MSRIDTAEDLETSTSAESVVSQPRSHDCRGAHLRALTPRVRAQVAIATCARAARHCTSLADSVVFISRTSYGFQVDMFQYRSTSPVRWTVHGSMMFGA